MPRILLFIALVLSSVGFAERPSLADIDAIVARASDLPSFLANQAWVDEYFAALDKFYGPGRLTRHAFDNIIGQMREATTKAPELAVRLWETNDLGRPFTIKARFGRETYSRGVEAGLWHSYFLKLTGRAGIDAKPFLDLGSDHERHEKLRAVMERIRDTRAAIAGAEFPELTAQKARRERGLRYDALARDPEVRAAEAYVAHLFYESEEATDHGRLHDADAIIGFFRDVRGNPRRLFSALPLELEDLAAQTLGGARNHLPTVDQMIKEKAGDKFVFPPRHHDLKTNAEVTYAFTPIPRRLHGAFWGAPMGACVGGCNAESLSPEFWAAVAVEGAEQHIVTRNEEFHGVIAATPGRLNGDTVASVALAAPDFSKKMFHTDPQSGLESASTLYGLWLKQAMIHKPEAWRGYVLGESNHFDNWKSHSAARNLGQYLLGDPLGHSHSFQFADPLVKTIIGALPRRGLARGYGGRMILDATVPGAGDLVLLSTEFDENLAADATKIRNALAGDDAGKKRRIVEFMMLEPVLAKRFTRELAELRDGHDASLAARATLALGETDPTKGLEARLVMYHDLPKNTALRERIVKEVNAATAKKPETIPLLEKHFDIQGADGRAALARAYVAAGGADKKAAPLMYDYILNERVYGDERVKVNSILNAEGMPTPEYSEHVQRHLRNLPADYNGYADEIYAQLGRLPSLAPETLVALRKLTDRRLTDANTKSEIEGHVRSAMMLMQPGGSPELAQIAVASLAKSWNMEHSKLVGNFADAEADRFMKALLALATNDDAELRARTKHVLGNVAYNLRNKNFSPWPPELVERLAQRLAAEGERDVRYEIAYAFQFLMHDEPRVDEAVLAEGRRADPAIIGAVGPALGVRPKMADAARAVLRDLVGHSDPVIRIAAYHALAAVKNFDAGDAALLARRAIDEPSESARLSASFALKRCIQLSGDDPVIEGYLMHGVVAMLRYRSAHSDADYINNHAVTATMVARRRYAAVEDALRWIRANGWPWTVVSNVIDAMSSIRGKPEAELPALPFVAPPPRPPAPPAIAVAVAPVAAAPVVATPPPARREKGIRCFFRWLTGG